MTIKSFEFTVHSGMDGRGELASVLECMKYLVAFCNKGSQSGMTHLEPAYVLFLMVGGSEGTRLQDCLLV